MTTAADRVAARFKAASLPPRLHIQSDDSEYLIWLEGPHGTRTFEPEKALPLQGLQLLYRAVLIDRPRIEASWVRDVMTKNNWLDVVIKEQSVAVTAYPSQPTSFTRDLDLAAWAESLGLGLPRHAFIHPTSKDIHIIDTNGKEGVIPIWTVLWVSDTDPSLMRLKDEDEPVVPFGGRGSRIPIDYLRCPTVRGLHGVFMGRVVEG